LADRPKKKAKVYAENVRADAEDLLRRLLVREALEYGLACSETAFVAVRSERGKPVEGTVAVANALPAGWSQGFVGGLPPAAGGGMLFCLAAPMGALDLGSVEPMDAGIEEFADVDTDRFHMELDKNSLEVEEIAEEGEDAGDQQPMLFAGRPRFQG